MVRFVNAGRAGNFLFECATALAYALDHNLDFTIPAYTDNPKWNPIYMEHLINPQFNPNLPNIDLWEGQHHFEKLPFEESWRESNITIHGYRQTEKYFAHRRNEILYCFDIPYKFKEGLVGIHVRRGDYVDLRMKHPEVTREWYERAMDLFPDKTFKVFSDDIDFCKEMFAYRRDVEYSTNTDEWSDLVEQSWCEHNICSPSTFSWWSMWLNQNKNKKAIFPDFWFTPNWCGLNTNDIVPEWCIKLP
jgi:hypothetical protein